jgi:hypothetical protein
MLNKGKRSKEKGQRKKVIGKIQLDKISTGQALLLQSPDGILSLAVPDGGIPPRLN